MIRKCVCVQKRCEARMEKTEEKGMSCRDPAISQPLLERQ